MSIKYDFCGWATRNDLKCSDGRVIKKDAFKDNDGDIVPLVWNHQHNEIFNVLGHAQLKNCDGGVRAYCTFNKDTEQGRNALNLVKNGDVTALSIYANNLKQNGADVMHGSIKEVSLVLAGANPGAYIDQITFAHGDDADAEAVIYTGLDDIELFHADEKKPEEETEETKKPAEKKPEEKEKEKMEDKTIQEVYDTLNEEQKNMVNALVGMAIEDAQGGADDDEGGAAEMKHNVFDDDYSNDDVLIHDGLNTILNDSKRYGSLKESYLAHAEEYGIENIDFLNPEYEDIHEKPLWINNQPTGWVDVVMNGVHNTPFAKVRMMFADITEDEARAKGYTKGKYKKEEVFKLLKRTVGPTTIYKKQKFDRDDLVDADFDVIPWIKQEMSLKLDEEKARAYLFGDGRSSADEDKVDEDCIIPIVSDHDLYAIKVAVTPEQGESFEHAFISAAVLAQDDYQGSGNTTAFIESKKVSRMLLMEDQFGHRLYKTVDELASAMGVGKVVKVPALIVPSGVYGVIVDLSDYNVGMKNAGKTNFFDDFDIDYNQNKYLLETRQSGALTKPYSAIVLKETV